MRRIASSWPQGALCSDEVCGQNLNVCETHTLQFELGSSVLFPCNFDIAQTAQIQSHRTLFHERKQHFSISWKHDLNSLVIFPSVGHVQFLLPERGRVKVFPNLGSRGNFSIRIDGLVFSDLGCYCCVHAETSDCHRVELVTAEGAAPEKTVWFPVSIFIVTAALLVFSFFIYNFYSCKQRHSADSPLAGGTQAWVNDDRHPTQPNNPFVIHPGLTGFYYPEPTQAEQGTRIYPHLTGLQNIGYFPNPIYN
ncbi:uncharacterized protein LOC103377656 isoform X2 [Cynoglossus semilaevis]|uniref:uncharacterized protein LOC103377656 isoform X2 n=1 Tax=Cynoglossus semilaevis TaxID=244447 RepID=UPI0004974855|nr:uncharacterized protein LOC103377656 isoform X2 [Cynoglossus semilaevis]